MKATITLEIIGWAVFGVLSATALGLALGLIADLVQKQLICNPA